MQSGTIPWAGSIGNPSLREIGKPDSMEPRLVSDFAAAGVKFQRAAR
jgi:hypothetical protein